MDNQKDKSKKPLKDTPDTDVVLAEDASFGYIAKKLEKLATAVHLITNFFEDDEPLRRSLRQKTLSLVSDVYTHKRNFNTQSIDTVALNLDSDLKETLSMLQVAEMSGYVSDMNFAILKREIENLREMLPDQHSSTPTPRLSDAFFKTDGRLSPASLAWSEDDPDRDTKADVSTKESTQSNTDARVQSAATDTVSDADDTEESPKTKRQKTILGLFEDADEITISDVKEVIDGYSSKTLQRDLSALVDKGILEKHGKRRWTSYTLTT